MLVRSFVLAAILCVIMGCSGPKTAPPPDMGDLSGAWLLETENHPVRFVDDDGDTLALTVGSEPLMLRQGQAVSDTSIAIEVVGLFISGAMDVAIDLDDRSTKAEFVTRGPSTGTLIVHASALSFLGDWTGQGFSGHFNVDEERAGKNARALDPQRAWSLHRIRGGGMLSN